jgi:hypothetical protein
MKTVLPLLVIVQLSLGFAGCGSTDKTSARSSQSRSPSQATLSSRSTSIPISDSYLNDADNDVIGDADSDNRHDNDSDNPEDHKPEDNALYHDSDDHSFLAFGHAAAAREEREVISAVKHYYAVAASGDGTEACLLLVPSIARAVPDDYGSGSGGPAYLRDGNSCPTVMSLLFDHFRVQLGKPLDVTGVRVRGEQAIALLGSKAIPAGEIQVRREGGVWMIGSVIGSALP